MIICLIATKWTLRGKRPCHRRQAGSALSSMSDPHVSQQREQRSAFGQTLLRHRTAAGLSQAALALASGMSVRALRELERGRAAAAQERSTDLLADALGLTGDERVSFVMLAKQGRRRSAEAENRAVLFALSSAPTLVGREAELRGLSEQAETGGVIVITGPPGVGKTTLAVAAAGHLEARFPDGCLAVDLHGADSQPVNAGVALERALTSLGVSRERMPAAQDDRGSLFRTLLRDRRVLLVLDNVLDETQIRPLLADSEHSLTIVTCRRMLTGLDSAHWLPLDMLSTTKAVDLVASIVGREVVQAEPEAAQELVTLCGNLPLAVRIAGNRLATRRRGSIAHLVGQLRDERNRLDSLSAGDLHLRSAFAVSLQMLPARERAVFRRLAVIPGSHFDDELAAVATGEPADEIGAVLDALVEVSLINITTAPAHFQFHDLLRLFARESWVEEEPEHVRDQLRDALYTHVLSQGTAAGTLFFPAVREAQEGNPFQSQREAAAWLDEQATTWIAVAREAAALGWYRTVYEFVWSLHRYLIGREFENRWDEVFLLGLEAARELADSFKEAEMLSVLGWTQHASANDSERALVTLKEARVLAQKIDYQRIVAASHASSGLVLASLGRVEEAIEHSKLACRLSVGRDFFEERIWMSLSLSTTLLAASEFDEALDLLGALRLELDSRRTQTNQELATKIGVHLLLLMGDSLSGLKRWPEAAEAYSEVRSHPAVRQAGYRSEWELALNEGTAWRNAGEIDRARTCLTFARAKLHGPADHVERERVDAELAHLPQ
ncbi:NB-ARC domain-containing protein [Streptomyces sp. ID05-26A]|nr:NB-ARC domain-containing protein [Streptomyces sp. ID05-26A]